MNAPTAPIHLHRPARSAESYGELVRDDRVHTSLYTDPAIFDAEMDKIFRNAWVWVAHESELPEPGSFKTHWVGMEPVIVSRDRKNAIHVLLNRCRHRAATVCEHKKGKTASFVCPYHGWAYALDGQLRGVPHPESYGDCLDKGEFPLVSLRVESYHGMVFATFRDDLEPLVDWLGPAKKWIALFMKQAGGYPVKVAGEHRFRFPGNWKIQLENTTDAYHFPLVHKSFLSSIDEETKQVFDFVKGPGYVEDLGHGHSVMVMIPSLVDLDANLDAPIPERFADLAAELRAEGHDDLTVRRLVRAVGGTGFNLNLFPNIACSMAFFRVLQPVAVNETEIHHAAIVMDGGPAAANQARLRLHEHFQGPMGFGTPDDSEAWERVQKGASAGTDLWVMVNRGLPGERVTADGKASDVSAETGMRAAYRQWKKLMTA
jgi:phenylpropionate dioxygenase-like ring-hydroxylating dioxygenase large terminal subunit